MDVAITEMRVTQGDRVVKIHREESSGVDKDIVAVQWRLTDGTRTIGVVPDDVFPQAQKRAAAYLDRMAEVDELRARAAAIEAAVVDDFRQPTDGLYMTAERIP